MQKEQKVVKEYMREKRTKKQKTNYKRGGEN